MIALTFLQDRVKSASLALVALGVAACTATHRPTAEVNDTEMANLLAMLDATDFSAEQKLRSYCDDAVIMAPGQAPIRGRSNLLAHLEEAAAADGVTMRHVFRHVQRTDNLIVTVGGVEGAWRETPQSDPVYFATNNIILFQDVPGQGVCIWKVIYNEAPPA